MSPYTYCSNKGHSYMYKIPVKKCSSTDASLKNGHGGNRRLLLWTFLKLILLL